ncbi:hypothetical protein As57867_005258, partial [Aphanomyces stellatus]
YRPDIDGLRALAVIPVVIFHAYPELLPGGFIGVDIFFVISGFLISSILYKEHAKGKFTYADFYARRIRRIFPALILVLGFTLVLGCLWLLAKPLKTMAATLVAGGLFSANLQLLSYEEGYFDASIKENPLLHLWSLGVEEQFYILWPMFVAFVVRLPPRQAIFSLVCFCCVSFAINIALLNYDNKYSFYFPLSRFWQMGVGGLLAYVNQSPLDSSTSLLTPSRSNRLSLSGLVCLLIGFTVIDESMAFPGYWALLPTLSAAVLITSGPSAHFNASILGSPLLVMIGKLSYPLYLWHWPLLVLVHAHFPNADLRPWFATTASVVLFSVLLSIVTWNNIENNARRSKSPWVVPVLSGLMAMCVLLATCVHQWPTAFSVLSQRIVHPINQMDTFNVLSLAADINWSRGPRLANATVDAIYRANDDWHCFDTNYIWTVPSDTNIHEDGVKVLNLNNSNQLVVVLGDSHANMVAPRFSHLFELAKNESNSFPQVMFRTRDGTTPLACTESHAADVAFIKATKPKAVMYISNWIQFLRPGGKNPSQLPPCCKAGYKDTCDYQSLQDVQVLIQRMADEIHEFVQLGIRVFVATANPEFDVYSHQSTFLLNGNQVGNVEPIIRSDFRRKHETLLGLLENATVAAHATLIDLSDNQCFEDKCQVISMKEGEPPMKDSNHIRPYFARHYLTVLDQVVHAALD